MAELLQEGTIQRPTGTGMEGRGPEVDLPSTGAPLVTSPEPTMGPQPVLQVTVRPSTTKNWEPINTALKTGASRDQVKSYLVQNLGLNEDDADLEIIRSVADKITKARANGADDQQIEAYMRANSYDPEVINSALKYSGKPQPWKNKDWDPNATPEDAKDLSDLYRNVYGKYSTTGKQILGVFDENKGIEARKELNQLNSSIADYLKKEGFDSFIDPEDGELKIRNNAGDVEVVDESLINDLWNTKGELAGAITGGILGAKAGAKVPGRSKLLTVPGGMITGSAIGAAAGRSFDLTVNSMRLKEQISAELYKDQMIEAGITDAIGSVIGGAVFKLGAASAKTVMKAYDFALAGNLNGAIKLLRENMHLSEDQAREITENFVATLNQAPTRQAAFGRRKELNPRELEIAAITSTQQGAGGFVRQAAAENPRLANAMLMNIDQRAKDITKAVSSISDDNVGALIRQDLQAYQKDVKDYFGAVKQQGAEAIDGTDFTFNLEKLAIEPVMRSIQKKISDPRNLENFTNYAARIENASADRSFSGLLELRQAVNDFKYSKTGLSKPDYDALNTVINKIDTQIAKAAKDYMPDAAAWQKNWMNAKVEYAKMKQVEENALFQSLNRKSATEGTIQKLLNKYGNDLDVDKEVFNNVVTRLSPATRAKAEGAAIKNLTKKFTSGKDVDWQAVHFPALDAAVKELNIETPEGKRLAEAIEQMAKVFKNDEELSGISGNMAVPKFAASLGADIGQKAKYAIVGEVWNTMKTLAPGKKANAAALAKHVSSVLENPMNFKSQEALINSVPKESQPVMRSLIKDLQAETAKQNAKNGGKQSSKQKMYKQTKTGKLATTSGALGKGVYLVDKVAAREEGSKIIAQEVNLNKMATLEQISQLVGQEVTEADIRKMPQIQQQLRDAGYLGIRVPGKAMLFPEQIVGQKLKKPVQEIPERVVSRWSDFKETASTINPTRQDFNYVTGNQDILENYASAGAIKNDFIVPAGTKVLNLSDEQVQKEVFKDLFKNEMPKDKYISTLEELFHDLHEGALNKRHPGFEKKLKDYMIKNGYKGHSFNGEEAFLPGVLKDIKK